MRNTNMKVWMWQRLYKVRGMDDVHSEAAWTDYEDFINLSDEMMNECCMYWLCPKPNLVLVNVN